MKELEPGDLYQKIFDNAVMAIGVTNMAGNYVMVNKAGASIWAILRRKPRA